MESVTITLPVAVLVRVTAAYRRAVQEEIKAGLQALEREEVRLAAAGKPAEREARLKETRAGLLARAREVEELADGRLVLAGRLESLAEVRVGDRWVAGVEIILEDGRVVAIRPGGGGAWSNT